MSVENVVRKIKQVVGIAVLVAIVAGAVVACDAAQPQTQTCPGSQTYNQQTSMCENAPPSFGCPAGQVYNAQTSQCGILVTACPANQVLAQRNIGGTNYLTCIVKETCTSNQIYIANTNTCVPREYTISTAFSGSATFVHNASNGTACTTPRQTIRLQFTSDQLSMASLMIFTQTLLNRNHTANVLDITAAGETVDTGRTIEYRFVRSTPNSLIIKYNLQDVLDQTGLTSGQSFQIFLISGSGFPFLSSGTIIAGIPGALNSISTNRYQIVTVTTNPTCI